MKKMIGAILVLLTIVLSIIYRQLTSNHKGCRSKASVPAVVQENLVLASMIIQ